MEGMGEYTFRDSKTFTISFCTGGRWLISRVGKEGSCPHILVGHQPKPWNSVHVHMFFQSELALDSVVEGGQRRGLTLKLTRVASWGPGKPCAWCMLLGCESEEDCVAGRIFLPGGPGGIQYAARRAGGAVGPRGPNPGWGPIWLRGLVAYPL